MGNSKILMQDSSSVRLATQGILYPGLYSKQAMATILYNDVLMLQFKVPMAVNIKATVFSNVTPYKAVKSHQHFGATCCLHNTALIVWKSDFHVGYNPEYVTHCIYV
jgi:hypothetical protein